MLHYCSLDDIKLLLKASSSYDDTFESVRAGVTGKFNTYMRRDLSFGNVTEYHDAGTIARGSPWYIYLDKLNVDKDTVVVTYNGRVLPTPEVDEAKGKVTLYGPTRFGKNAVRVTYSGGFEASADDAEIMAVPAEIRTAAIQQCIWELNEMINNDGGAKDSERGRGAKPKERTMGGLIMPVATTLNAFRRPLIRMI